MEQSDESHVSFESSSSVLPNQLDEDDFLPGFDEVSFELEDFFEELDPVMKFSIAFPIIFASTILLPSHFNLLSGDRVSLALGLLSPALVSVLSRNLSIASFAKDTVGFALTDFRRAIAGWCLFVNHPGSTDDFSDSAVLEDDPVANCLILW